MLQHHRFTGWALASLLAVGILGCGNSHRLATAPVAGKVTLDGSPVAEATIILQPEKGRSAHGKIKNGEIVELTTYVTNDGAVLGGHRIAVQPAVKEGPMKTLNPTDGPGGGRGGPTYMSEAPVQRQRKKKLAPGEIPEAYRNPSKSGLSAEITKGTNELTLQLVSQ